MKSIFEYLEYRDFLKDHYEYNKQKYPFFSYRYISRKTGLDASFYVKVIQKQLHITQRAIKPLADFLKLSKKETEYFECLFKFNRAKNIETSKIYFEKLLEMREPKIHTLDSAKYEFFNKWYYIAIKELLNYYKFKGDYKELATKLNPAISVSEAKHAIELLEKLDLIKRDEKGYYRLTEQFITTGESWNSIAIENFQKQVIALAGESISRIPKKHRETSTITVSISKKCFESIKERLKEFRKELLEMARQDENPEAVYHINFQIFPLTAICEEEKDK
jgi:uncharacterized protein (TIGR02147 family)